MQCATDIRGRMDSVGTDLHQTEPELPARGTESSSPQTHT